MREGMSPALGVIEGGDSLFIIGTSVLRDSPADGDPAELVVSTDTYPADSEYGQLIARTRGRIAEDPAEAEYNGPELTDIADEDEAVRVYVAASIRATSAVSTVPNTEPHKDRAARLQQEAEDDFLVTENYGSVYRGITDKTFPLPNTDERGWVRRKLRPREAPLPHRVPLEQRETTEETTARLERRRLWFSSRSRGRDGTYDDSNALTASQAPPSLFGRPGDSVRATLSEPESARIERIIHEVDANMTRLRRRAALRALDTRGSREEILAELEASGIGEDDLWARMRLEQASLQPSDEQATDSGEHDATPRRARIEVVNEHSQRRRRRRLVGSATLLAANAPLVPGQVLEQGVEAYRGRSRVAKVAGVVLVAAATAGVVYARHRGFEMPRFGGSSYETATNLPVPTGRTTTTLDPVTRHFNESVEVLRQKNPGATPEQLKTITENVLNLARLKSEAIASTGVTAEQFDANFQAFVGAAAN